uniref:Uncharacterized protein n=1 Tax=Lygus hesperus TaxID=30085 RepID=A0A0K8SBG0_LYGHE
MEVTKRNQTTLGCSALNSSSDRTQKSKRWYNGYEPNMTLLLVFDSKKVQPELKQRIRELWKILYELPTCDINPRAENYVSLLDEEINEKTPTPEPVAEENRVRLLFEKMLDMRMDQHALAIADGYRTRPLVCLCDDVCCNCFDHTKFLHNLKLHDHKELLRTVYAEMTNKNQKPTSKSEITQEPQREGDASNKSDDFNEFTLKNEEDDEGDDPHDLDLDLSVIGRIKKMVCEEKTVSAPKTASTPPGKVKRGVRVIKKDEQPYETKFNSVHRRVREFDPNSYKNLVREEMKRFNEMTASERRLRSANYKNLSQRPPWKI